MSNDTTHSQTPDPQSSTSSDSEKSETTPKPNEELIQYLSEEFDRTCQERHDVGAVEYGPTKFLEPDVDLTKMIEEELADFANYARYLYIRVRMLGIAMGKAAPLPTIEPQGADAIGANAFFPSGGENG